MSTPSDEPDLEPPLVVPEDAELAPLRMALGAAVAARVLFPRLGDADLEPSDAQILLALQFLPDQGVTDLAATLHLSKPTVSQALARVIDAGFVRETADPQDGRRRRHALTTQGTRRVRKLSGRLQERTSSLKEPKYLAPISDEPVRWTVRLERWTIPSE